MPVITLNQVQKDQNLDPDYLKAIENLQKLTAASGAGSDYEAALNAAVAARDQAEKDAKAKNAQQANPLLAGLSPDTALALQGGNSIPQAASPQAPDQFQAQQGQNPNQSDIDAAVSAIGARAKNWGAPLISSIQKEVGANPDGSWGPATASALAQYMAQHPNAGVVPAGGSALQFVSGDNPAGGTASVLPVNPAASQAAQIQLAQATGATPEQARQMVAAGSPPDRQSGSVSSGTRQAIASGGSQTSKGGNQALLQDLFLQAQGSSLDQGNAGEDAYRRELQNQLGTAALANAVAGGINPVQAALQGENTIAASEDRNQATLMKARMDDVTKALNSAMVQVAAFNRAETDLRSRIYAADQRLKGMRANASAGITKAQIAAQAGEIETLMKALATVQSAKTNAMGRLASNNLALVSPGAAQMGLNILGDAASTATIKNLYGVGGGVASKNGLLPYMNADESSVSAGDPGLRDAMMDDALNDVKDALGIKKSPAPPIPAPAQSTQPSGPGWSVIARKNGQVGWFNKYTNEFRRTGTVGK